MRFCTFDFFFGVFLVWAGGRLGSSDRLGANGFFFVISLAI
jgi:hypothetical protein